MNDWQYHPPADIDESMSEYLRNFPRQPHMLAYAIRSIAALLLRGWMRVYHRLRIDGRDNLPVTGSYVLVCNHTSHLDTLCMLSSVPIKRIHRTFPAAAADYFFSTLPRSAISAVLINALPFDRKVNVLIIFPEGTRTTSGEMGRFRSGIGRLVVGTDLPVVPCHLAGGRKAWPKGKAIPRPSSLHLRIGVPRQYEHFEKSSESVKQICQELEHDVAALGRNTHDHL
jgi:1-acyl-sn-glycerol-3-phosphate acyltransferase